MKIDGKYVCQHFTPIHQRCDMCKTDREYRSARADILHQQARDVSMLVRASREMLDRNRR